MIGVDSQEFKKSDCLGYNLYWTINSFIKLS